MAELKPADINVAPVSLKKKNKQILEKTDIEEQFWPWTHLSWNQSRRKGHFFFLKQFKSIVWKKYEC